MKTIHWNKVAAIMDTKTRAFFGKNCIIMPIFAIVFTFIMKLLYVNVMEGEPGMDEFARGYSLAMGLVMGIGMIGIYCPALLLAEEKEKNTLRVLMTSSVNGLEFFLGSIIPVFLATGIVCFLLIPVSGYDMAAADIPAFAAVILMASLISCIVGMVLGIFAKNQVSAGTVITPVLMVFMLIPMFANLIEALEKISQFTFTGIVMEMMMRMMEGGKSLVTAQGIAVMAVEAALAVVLFICLQEERLRAGIIINTNTYLILIKSNRYGSWIRRIYKDGVLLKMGSYFPILFYIQKSTCSLQRWAYNDPIGNRLILIETERHNEK